MTAPGGAIGDELGKLLKKYGETPSKDREDRIPDIAAAIRRQHGADVDLGEFCETYEATIKGCMFEDGRRCSRVFNKLCERLRNHAEAPVDAAPPGPGPGRHPKQRAAAVPKDASSYQDEVHGVLMTGLRDQFNHNQTIRHRRIDRYTGWDTKAIKDAGNGGVKAEYEKHHPRLVLLTPRSGSVKEENKTPLECDHVWEVQLVAQAMKQAVEKGAQFSLTATAFVRVLLNHLDNIMPTLWKVNRLKRDLIKEFRSSYIDQQRSQFLGFIVGKSTEGSHMRKLFTSRPPADPFKKAEANTERAGGGAGGSSGGAATGGAGAEGSAAADQSLKTVLENLLDTLQSVLVDHFGKLETVPSLAGGWSATDIYSLKLLLNEMRAMYVAMVGPVGPEEMFRRMPWAVPGEAAPAAATPAAVASAASRGSARRPKAAKP